MGVNVGEEVGYVVRFERKAGQKRNRLAYVTDGALLQISKKDSDFKLMLVLSSTGRMSARWLRASYEPYSRRRYPDDQT
ncbi:hypothetical protein NW762_009648 [Fusarium torreyae]|uniref:Uncharacterized protein n=1 Tax=Fusarium torreyae TaxID=1237075 RepID=A0A9W8RSP7_9HYPO|nr:hypothetical protein NW762_009648 [Fusarium torreyae]